ncbi:ENTH/ANTH/VHS superfamily protein [Striga asiatica]|uniref:ENTH/ANTH/VHS superfamily protein n=1 Tax=Striga asiatica TaxID=4170 RepID=A0A5A7PPE4_STRAF|nr:ENTH/ANTH/VHS superfamily protein [Striga asiatica]
MGKITSFRDLIGAIKDKAALSKASLLPAGPSAAALPIRLAVLRATAHLPPSPPDDRRISALLLLGDTSRAAAAPVVSVVVDRLRRTGSSVVALKCFLVLHHAVRRGPFILRDQISVFPAAGGRNHLNLSRFREDATPATWILSAWVRWHARYLETLLSASRAVGYFLCSSTADYDRRISSSLNADLVGVVDSLVGLVEEICRAPDYSPAAAEGELLVKEVVRLLLTDYISLVNELVPRLAELSERLSCMSFGESVEVLCAMKRLEECRERLSVLCAVDKPSIKTMWALVHELKEKVGTSMVCAKDGGKLLSWGIQGKMSESARFEGRVLGKVDSVKFQSGRFVV